MTLWQENKNGPQQNAAAPNQNESQEEDIFLDHLPITYTSEYLYSLFKLNLPRQAVVQFRENIAIQNNTHLDEISCHKITGQTAPIERLWAHLEPKLNHQKSNPVQQYLPDHVFPEPSA